MRIIYYIIQAFSDVFAFYSIGIIIDYICAKKKKRTFDSKKHKLWTYICGILLFFTVFLSAPIQELVRLDNICLKPDGNYCYYISVYDYDNQKSFKVPAQIQVDSNKYLLGDVFVNDEIIFFYNEYELELNKKVYIPEAVEKEDYTFSDWECTLLNERAYDVKYKFDNGVTPLNITFDLIRILLLLATVIIYIKEENTIVNTDDST